jgi:drug/metabolite transporter (DMT)-like permease
MEPTVSAWRLWAGLAILLLDSGDLQMKEGRAWGLFSGICAGSAYLILAKTKGRHNRLTVSFYWCMCSIIFVAALGIFQGISWPLHHQTYYFLALSGILATCAQWLTTLAYDWAPATTVSATNYLIPGIGFTMEYAVWHKELQSSTLLALAFITLAGIIFPFLAMKRS